MGRTINTSGPVDIGGANNRQTHVNTSRVVEEDMTYEDEPPEIIALSPGMDDLMHRNEGSTSSQISF